MLRRWHHVTGLALAAALITSSCGDKEPEGPTVIEAEQTLKAHINKLVGTGVGNVRHVKVIDPGGRNVPCGKDKAKRTYAVSGDKNDPKKDDLSFNSTDLANHMFANLIANVGEYDVVDPDRDGAITKTRNSATHTNITIRAHGERVVEIYGSTDCLPSG
ncbi:hypothetical protein [Actinomadura miaoliensis]|uniref:Uncharacterized protein n=1 Tax=Actinomadura miaoliensis TaxID=430685 RepID=A0ABP7VSM3_9ACTN